MKQFFELKNKRPYAATLREWKEWKLQAKADEPFKYWLVETVPDWFEDRWRNITKPYNDLRYALRCRVFDKYHVINTGLPPGYADCDTRMLHGMFNLLVDYIEVEKAWMNVVFNKDLRHKTKTPWWSIGWTRFKSFRNVEAGLAYLNWEMTLDNPNLDVNERSDSQAKSAREQLALYKWWKEVRPARPDPMDASGWTDFCEKLRVNHGNDDTLDLIKTPEEEIECKAVLEKNRQIDQAYEDEDTANLIRLIKIRSSLWT